MSAHCHYDRLLDSRGSLSLTSQWFEDELGLDPPVTTHPLRGVSHPRNSSLLHPWTPSREGLTIGTEPPSHDDHEMTQKTGSAPIEAQHDTKVAMGDLR